MMQNSGNHPHLTFSGEAPVVPIGLDSFLMWDRLPYHRIGVRAYMRSTHDREGNNFGADGGHFLYQESDTFNVAMDEKGPGILYFVRTNHFHGSPWHYEIDGNDFIVKETSTDQPVGADQRVLHPVFIPEELFPHPLTVTWRQSQGGDLMCVPLMFEESMRLAFSRTFYGTGYFILHKLAPGIKHISRPLQSWDRQPPDRKVLELIRQSGTDIAPKDNTAVHQGEFAVKAGETVTVADIAQAPSMVRALKLTVPKAKAYEFGKSRLRITWDGSRHASVDAPVALFFGSGHLYNKDNREYLVKGFISNIRYDEENVHLDCYWPMPFFKSVKLEIADGAGVDVDGVRWELRTEAYRGPANHVSYFHATYTDHPEPEEGKYIQFLDTDRVEGGGPWSGHFVGLSWILTHSGRVMLTVEGHPRFTFDDSRTPQATGTGTEELAGGGDHWKDAQYSSQPFFGHPVGRMGGKKDDNPLELLNSAYRFLISDHFPFGKRAVIELKHGAKNDTREHYEGVAYWYGVNDASLVLTDEVRVCDEEDREKHQVRSDRAQAPYVLTSRFESAPHEDYPGQREYIPEEADSVRITKGTTEFEVQVDPNNLGVMLRRKFDCLYPNQCARVWIKRKSIDEEWQDAGEWYTAGSNTFAYSKPSDPMRKLRNFSIMELAPTEHHIVTSSKRWREEEFLIAPELTKEAGRLAIKLEYVPVERDLFPGQKFPVESAWSESSYKVYCYRLPANPLL